MTDHKELTPLMLAAKEGNAFKIASLLAEGADPAEQNSLGQTAQQIAEENGFNEIAEMLDYDEDTITDYEETIIVSKDEDITIPDIDNHTDILNPNPIEKKSPIEASNSVITGIKIPFISMIGIMFKWIMATIIASAVISSFGYLLLFIFVNYIQ